MTATLLVVATTGLTGALRLAIGFLLAVAPFAIISLLFNATNGLFVGWLRTLIGAALGLVGVTIVTALHLAAIDSEFAYLRTVVAGDVTDLQGLMTIVAFFALVAVVMVLVGLRMGAAIKLPVHGSIPLSMATAQIAHRLEVLPGVGVGIVPPAPFQLASRARAAVLAEALTNAMGREDRTATAAGPWRKSSLDRGSGSDTATTYDGWEQGRSIGVAGRRDSGRRTRSAARRDAVT